MKRILLSDNILLVGDLLADLVAEYAVLLGRVQSADSITMNAISHDGDAVNATVVLNWASNVIVETTTSAQPEPENTAAEAYLRKRLEHYEG